MNEQGERKTHWLVEGLGGVNIIVVIGAFIAASWYVFEIRAAQTYLTSELRDVKNELKILVERQTEIAQLGWRLDNLQSLQNRISTRLDTLQETVRLMDVTLRDVQAKQARHGDQHDQN